MSDSNCHKCCESVIGEDRVICDYCERHFHYSCCGFTERSFRRITRSQATLLCSECRLAAQKKPRSDSASVTPTDTDVLPSNLCPQVDSELFVSERMMEKLCTKVIDGLSRNVKTIIAEELSTYAREMGELRVSLGVVNKEFDEFKIRLSNLNDENVLLKNKLTELEHKNQELEYKIDELATVKAERSKHPSNEDHIKARCDELSIRVSEFEQRSRRSNIELQNIPEKEREDLVEIVQRISTKIGIPVCSGDIAAIHRVRKRPQEPTSTTEKRPRNIVVRFCLDHKRDVFLAAARAHRGFPATEIGYSNTNTRVFITEHLTLENKLLHREVRAWAKAKNYRFVWVKNARIFLREKPDSQVFHITSVQDLRKLG